MTVRSMPTAVIGFKTECAREVRHYLDGLEDAASTSMWKELDATKVIHSASLSMIETSGTESFILLELSADCDESDALALFAEAVSPSLAQLLKVAGLPLPAQWRPWLLSQRVTLGLGVFSAAGLLFDGSPAMSVNRIKREQDLADWVENQPDLLAGPQSPATKLHRIRSALWREGTFKWAFAAEPAPILEAAPTPRTTRGKVMRALRIARQMLIWPCPVIPVVYAAMLLLPHPGGLFGRLAWSLFDTIAVLVAVAVLVGGAFAIILRRRERTDSAPDAKPNAKALERVLRTENMYLQNTLMTTSELKPGYFRRACLSLAFLVIRTLLPLAWAPGKLGDLDDIHFARWVLLPRTNLLVFRSHYDGSWLSYLHDFVLRAPQGVTLVWSNTLGFPRSRWLALGGAADGPRFLQWARVQTRPAPFWYSAYPDLSMTRIRLHAGIARAIATGAVDAEVGGWLGCLGAASMVRS